MRKGSLNVVSLCISFCLLFTGCSTASTVGGSSQAELQSTASRQEYKEAAKQPEGDADMSGYIYTTQEIWVKNGDMNIYGVAYVPDTDGKVPLVIFSHELGNDHRSGERYAERLAEAGYAAYVFDFCGGSMGGLVTTVVGSQHQEEIAGMILMYPALSAKADSGTERYKTEDEVPEEVSLFGGWIHVGKNYVTDLWKVDFDQLLSSYKGHMLLLHGDKDSTVPISWSENAKEIIPDCEFHVIPNGGHEFFGQPFEDAMAYILPYLDTQVGKGKADHN